ncbi:SPOR domain-containing protein, partial [Roseivivax sp. CAU 1761]
MKATILLTATLLCLGAAPAMAQPAGTDIPAELPPEDYEGRQYVDSRGCVYVRAGIDGAVTWVPRMTRSRQHLCGAPPTDLAESAPESGPGDAARAEGVERIAPETVPRAVARPERPSGPPPVAAAA